jgi:hypothetical protein
MFASLIAPFFVEVSPEIRSSYISLGKLLEDRPMALIGSRIGIDTGDLGRFSLRNWEESSLTDRLVDTHRHVFYNSEFGISWQYVQKITETWKVYNDLSMSWTIYRGWKGASVGSNHTYKWCQIEQALINPYVVPFWRLRKYVHGTDYFHFRVGAYRKIPLWTDWSVTPSVFTEGGDAVCVNRIVGRKPGGGDWNGGVAAASARIELGWLMSEHVSLFVFAEQYMVVGGEERRANRAGSYVCAHNDWTLGGFGARIKF